MGKRVDESNMARLLDEFPQQIKEAARLGGGLKFSGIKSVVLCGMGGSGLPGEFLRNWNLSIPIYAVKDYTVPKYITKQSLAVCISYSGNTEETLAAYREVKRRGAKVVTISSGGKLEKQAKKDSVPQIKVPSGIQPRMAFGYQMIPVLKILISSGLVKGINFDRLSAFMAKERTAIKKRAKELANKAYRRIPIIYSSAQFFPVAYKWKIDFNENAKIHAFCNYYPEWNHNEINGLIKLNGKYIVFILRDKDDHSRIKKRMSITQKLIKRKKVDVVSIDSKGFDRLSRMLYTVYLGDWTAYYTAIKLGIDPTPVNIIEDLKKALKK